MSDIVLPTNCSLNEGIYNRIEYTNITKIDNSNRDIKELELKDCTIIDGASFGCTIKDSLILNIGTIKSLRIINSDMYYSNDYEKLIDIVENDGTIYFHGSIIKELDCSRFKNVQLDNCIVLNLIDPYNIAKLGYRNDTDYDYNDSRTIICNKLNDRYKTITCEDGIYCGEVSYRNDCNKTPYRNGYGRMTFTNNDRLIDVFEGEWVNDKIDFSRLTYTITYRLPQRNIHVLHIANENAHLNVTDVVEHYSNGETHTAHLDISDIGYEALTIKDVLDKMNNLRQ
jgi:hypothetical protein